MLITTRSKYTIKLCHGYCTAVEVHALLAPSQKELFETGKTVVLVVDSLEESPGRGYHGVLTSKSITAGDKVLRKTYVGQR